MESMLRSLSIFLEAFVQNFVSLQSRSAEEPNSAGKPRRKGISNAWETDITVTSFSTRLQ